jgi:hypothetical protein
MLTFETPNGMLSADMDRCLDDHVLGICKEGKLYPHLCEDEGLCRYDKKEEKSMCMVCSEEVGDVSDRERWYRLNPSLGYQLLEEALAKDVNAMSPDSFAREHLGFMAKRHEVSNIALDLTAWEKCKSDAPKPEGKTAYGVKFSADGSTVSLCGAVIPKDGKARISLIEMRPTAMGTQWLADWLNARYNQASCVVIDGRNGVDVLVDKIASTWRYKGSVIRPNAKEIIASVSMLTDALAEESVTWYAGQEILNDSATTSTKRPIAGGWGFGGDNPTPIEACALALYGVKTCKRDPNRVMRIG